MHIHALLQTSYCSDNQIKKSGMDGGMKQHA